MGRGVELPSDWKERLRRDGEKDRISETAEQFRSLVKEADAIPLRTKAQYPLYMEARTLHMIRGLAKIDRTTVQESIRTLLEEGIARRVRKVPKKTAKKRGKVNKRAS